MNPLSDPEYFKKNFEEEGIQRLKGGTLPVYVMYQKSPETGKRTIGYKLLPCSSGKQHLYPDFIGYLFIRQAGNEEVRLGINVDTSVEHGFRINNLPDSSPEERQYLQDIVSYMMGRCSEAGHQFPIEVRGTLETDTLVAF